MSRAHVIAHARANLKWQQARDISDAGGTFEDAIAATGMRPAGLRVLIWKHAGSTVWPIASPNPRDDGEK